MSETNILDETETTVPIDLTYETRTKPHGLIACQGDSRYRKQEQESRLLCPWKIDMFVLSENLTIAG